MRIDSSNSDASAIPRPALGTLTERELDVLVLIARGPNNAEIAEPLVLSPLTIKTHVSRILAKTLARDRVQPVIAAYAAGLVNPAVSQHHPDTGGTVR